MQAKYYLRWNANVAMQCETCAPRSISRSKIHEFQITCHLAWSRLPHLPHVFNVQDMAKLTHS